MNLLKHILVIISLLAAALPCCHAHEIDQHDHDAPASLCETHSCSCHSCEEIPCGDAEDMPQELVEASVNVAAVPSSALPYIFKETRPVVRPAPLKVSGTLARIQTVQLLI